MPENYTRSRSKISRGYNDVDGGYAEPRPGIAYRRNSIGIAVTIAAVLVLLVGGGILIFALKGCSAPAAGDDANAFTDTPDATSSDFGDLYSTASPDPSAGETIDPDATGTAENGDTAAPGDTSQPDDTSEPDDTATGSPSDTPQPTDAPGDTSSPSTADIGPVEGTANVTDYLSLRSSASQTASTLEKIPKDETFTVLAVGSNNAWLKVKYSGKTGYVVAKYVKIGNSDDNKVCTVTSGSVNVRSGAGTSNSLVGSLKSGDTVIVTQVVKDTDDVKWYKVAIGSGAGYISSKYCRLSGS